MGLNSHLYTNYYVPMYNLVPLSLPRVDVRTMAHHLYTFRILWCISSTIHFTLITTTKIQIYKLYVQCCTSHLCYLRSVFRLRTKIFTTTRERESPLPHIMTCTLPHWGDARVNSPSDSAMEAPDPKNIHNESKL